MAGRSGGRGAAAVVGFLLLIGGLIAAGVLAVMAVQRPGDAVDSFARAVPGCTTTLEFTEVGTFYVFVEEGSSYEPAESDCEPSADGFALVEYTIRGPSGEVVPRRDDSIEYDNGTHAGVSDSRFVVTEVGEYEIEVHADDPTTVAAIGRDPDDGVDELWTAAVIVGAAGVLLGVLFLLLAGRRSRQAAVPHVPQGPGWTLAPPEAAPPARPPLPPSVPEVPSTPPERPTSPWAPPGHTSPTDLPQPTEGRPSAVRPATGPIRPSEPSHDGDDLPEDRDVVG